MKRGYLTQSAITGYRIGVNAGYVNLLPSLHNIFNKLCSFSSTWIRSACATYSECSGQLRLLFNELAHLSSTITNLIFILDDLPGDLLLNDCLSPVIIEPVVLYFLYISVREEKRVLCANDVEINFKVDDMIVEGSHYV